VTGDPSSDDVPARVARAIDLHLDGYARPLVEAYFNPSKDFAGRDFDTLAPNPPNEIGLPDLLAITLLDVAVGPLAMRTMLGWNRDETKREWDDLPLSTDLWDASEEHLAAADVLYRRLRGLPGVDWVIAHKLLARKRPRMIPVLDSVVVKALALPKTWRWQALASALRDPRRQGRINALGPYEGISTLRLLDVAVWMRASNGEKARAERHALRLPDSAPRRRTR
jgi:hypothetical protein